MSIVPTNQIQSRIHQTFEILKEYSQLYPFLPLLSKPLSNLSARHSTIHHCSSYWNTATANSRFLLVNSYEWIFELYGVSWVSSVLKWSLTRWNLIELVVIVRQVNHQLDQMEHLPPHLDHHILLLTQTNLPIPMHHFQDQVVLVLRGVKLKMIDYTSAYHLSKLHWSRETLRLLSLYQNVRISNNGDYNYWFVTLDVDVNEWVAVNCRSQ